MILQEVVLRNQLRFQRDASDLTEEIELQELRTIRSFLLLQPNAPFDDLGNFDVLHLIETGRLDA